MKIRTILLIGYFFVILILGGTIFHHIGSMNSFGIVFNEGFDDINKNIFFNINYKFLVL